MAGPAPHHRRSAQHRHRLSGDSYGSYPALPHHNLHVHFTWEPDVPALLGHEDRASEWVIAD